MLKYKGTVLLIIAVLLVNPLSSFSDILFEDDFETGNLSKWTDIPNMTMKVTKDPDDAGNQVLEQQGEANGAGVPIPKGTEEAGWTDYIWEFDWRWSVDTFVGTAYRYQGIGNYYHGSRRQGGSFSIFDWNGNFILLVNQPWPSESGVWYRIQNSFIGDEHLVKTKERDDETSFEAIDPIVSIKDDTYKEGTIGLFGTGEGMLYWDNIIVYEPGTNIHAVTSMEKLATIWGTLKSQ